MNVIDQLRQEYATKLDDGKKLIEKAAAEGRDPTAEEQTTIDGNFARLESITKTIEQHQKFAKLKLETDEGTSTVPGKAEYEAAEKGESEIIVSEPKIDQAEFSRAASRWAFTGEMHRKFATITTATGSGILLPRQITAPIVPTTVNAYRRALALHGVLPIETANSANLTVPVLDATAGGVVAENATAENENTPSLADSINLNVKTLGSGSVWFSNQQLAATDFNLLDSTLPGLTYSKEYGLEAAITAGIIAASGITQNVTLTGTTSAGLTYARLVQLNRRLPQRYDSQKAIILSADAFAAAESILGSDGHPVLVPDPQNNELWRFNGTPVLRDDHYEAFGASKVVGAVISLLGFKLRDVTVQNLARYINYPGKPNQTGLELFAYHGWGWANAAVAKLITSAS